MRKFIFYLILAIAAFGLMMNLDEFLFSIMKAIISFAIIALIIYIIYYFFFLTEDQRKYKKHFVNIKTKKAIRRYQMMSPYCSSSIIYGTSMLQSGIFLRVLVLPLFVFPLILEV